MTWSTELRTLESHFATQWGATTPIHFQEAGAFTPPSDHSPWVRFQILQGESAIVAGHGAGGRYRHPGVIQIDIQTAKGKGTAPALSLADQAAAIFRGKRIGDVLCRAPALSEPTPDGGYYRVTVSIRYQRDENF